MLNTNLQAMDLHLPLDKVESYIAHVNQIPLLTHEEERDYADRLQKGSHVDAAKPLILSHLRYVVRIARGYLGYGLPLQDLIQEGNIGLMKAVKRFNPDLGARLATFAIHWIKAEIHEFILRNWRIVKVATTKSQRKLFFNLRTMKKRLGWLTQNEMNDVAKKLGVKSKTVMEMEMRMHSVDTSFDEHEDEDVALPAPAAYLEDHRYSPTTIFEKTDASQQSHTHLHEALKQLDKRSQAIVSARWLTDTKATLQDLAKHYSVSAERIRQLEKTAMQKLKQALASVS